MANQFLFFATEKGENKDIGVNYEKNKITLPKNQ